MSDHPSDIKSARLIRPGNTVRINNVFGGISEGIVRRVEMNIWLDDGTINPIDADSTVAVVQLPDLPPEVVAEVESFRAEG